MEGFKLDLHVSVGCRVPFLHALPFIREQRYESTESRTVSSPPPRWGTAVEALGWERALLWEGLWISPTCSFLAAETSKTNLLTAIVSPRGHVHFSFLLKFIPSLACVRAYACIGEKECVCVFIWVCVSVWVQPAKLQKFGLQSVLDSPSSAFGKLFSVGTPSLEDYWLTVHHVRHSSLHLTAWFSEVREIKIIRNSCYYQAYILTNRIFMIVFQTC